MAKIDEGVGMNNHFTMDGGGKLLVRTFKRKDFFKCIFFVVLAVNYGKKVHKTFSEILKIYFRMAPTKLQRDVRGNNDLYKVCCDKYRHLYIYACH